MRLVIRVARYVRALNSMPLSKFSVAGYVATALKRS